MTSHWWLKATVVVFRECFVMLGLFCILLGINLWVYPVKKYGIVLFWTETKQDWQRSYLTWLWWFTDDGNVIGPLVRKCVRFGTWNRVYESIWIWMGILEHSDWWTERTSQILWTECQWWAFVNACVCSEANLDGITSESRVWYWDYCEEAVLQLSNSWIKILGISRTL